MIAAGEATDNDTAYFCPGRPGRPGRPGSSFNDVALRDCQNCCINRPYSTRQAALERQDLSCTYLAHHELESLIFFFIFLVSGQQVPDHLCNWMSGWWLHDSHYACATFGQTPVRQMLKVVSISSRKQLAASG